MCISVFDGPYFEADFFSALFERFLMDNWQIYEVKE
jgi:hypothetical protein